MAKWTYVEAKPIEELEQEHLLQGHRIETIADLREFEEFILGAKNPIFVDEEKAYSVKGKKFMVFFHPGREFMKRFIAFPKPIPGKGGK